MKFGIYARGLSGIGGVKQYIEAMCRALIDTISENDELHIFHNLEAPYFKSKRDNIFEVLLKSKNRFRCDLIEAPKVINAKDLDAVWFTKYVVPFGVKAKTVTTVHDLAYYMPELGAYAFSDTLYMRVMIRNSLRRADHIVSVSHHTKQDIIETLGVSEEKITVIHEAADSIYRIPAAPEVVEAWRKQRDLPRRFVLFTGGLSPRKNLLRLIRAFEKTQAHIPHKLVLTGGKGWRNKEILEAIEENADVIRLGFVPDEEMPLLYAAADLFVYPSLYEGFGLPILEAQSVGCPVLSSNNSSLTEVAGDSVRFIDPLDVNDMSDAMISVLSSPDAQKRLIKKGRENADRFSWNQAAKLLLETFASLD